MKRYEESEELNHSDTEITLGTRSILGVFFGLALICGVFFGFGYSIGRGNAGKERALEQPASTLLGTAPASVKTVVEEPAPSEPETSSEDGYNPDSTPASSATTNQAKPSAVATVVPQTPQTITPAAQPMTPVPASSNPATANPSAATMIQIAAVSRRADADVLVSALGKLGYNASVRNETTDSLLHVQIGPFATRNEAQAMRAKLLNDGYNAILK